MWPFLEQYRELISNGLDLLSFLLVTPELLRFTQPLLGKATYWIGWGVLSGATLTALLGPIYLFLLIAATMGSLFFSWKVWTPEDWWKRKGPTMSRWISAHAFILGVGLFFISRLVGFGVALHTVIALGE